MTGLERAAVIEPRTVTDKLNESGLSRGSASGQIYEILDFIIFNGRYGLRVLENEKDGG